MDKLSYRCHRFPSIVIQHAVWLYFRFALSYRDVEDMLAERGIDVSYETVRRWALKFGGIIARKLRRGRPRPDGRWHLDEVFDLHQRQTVVCLACRGQRRRGSRARSPSGHVAVSARPVFRIGTALSLNPCRRLQCVQHPPPSDLPSDPARVSRPGYADVAPSDSRSVNRFAAMVIWPANFRLT